MGAPGGDGRWLRRRSATFQVIRQLPNSCQIVYVCVCVWFFLGWTTAHIPAGLAAISTPCFANLNDFITFFPIFLSNSAGIFFPALLCSSRHFAPSALPCHVLLLLLPLHCYFHLKFPQGYNKMRQKISRTSSSSEQKKKATRIAAMQICRRPRTVRGFYFFFQHFLFFFSLSSTLRIVGGGGSHPSPLEIRLSCCLNAGCKFQWTAWAPVEI